MLSCILSTLGMCIDDYKVKFTDEKELVVKIENDCRKDSRYNTLEVNVKFDKYRTVFNTRTNSSIEDIEFKFDC